MKLLIFTLWLVLAGAASGLAQGTVDFRNGGITFRTPADRKVYLGFPGGPGLTGTTWVAGLWYLKGEHLSLPLLSGDLNQVGRNFNFRPATTTLPGAWVAPAGVSPIFTFPDVDIGETATLQVRVWDSAKFAAFDGAVAAGEFGVSCLFLYTVPLPGSAPDAYYMDNFRGIPCIPEPSTSTWLVLGAGLFAWLGWRRPVSNRTR
jgi:hypothetical protein